MKWYHDIITRRKAVLIYNLTSYYKNEWQKMCKDVNDKRFLKMLIAVMTGEIRVDFYFCLLAFCISF